MAARKRAAAGKPVTLEELEQVIDKYVEVQRAFLLTMARRVTAEAKEQEKRQRASGGGRARGRHKSSSGDDLGAAAILRQHPHTCPNKTKKSPAPRFHAASKAAREG